MYVSLLERQIKRFIKPGVVIPSELRSLLDAVNQSYEHYERDHLLAKQSLEISSAELHEMMQELEKKEANIQNSLKRELEMQKQLVNAARESGKMQTATSVLHNVGNVLNSVNISLSILYEKHSQSRLNNLAKIADLLKIHRENLSDFLGKDGQGRGLLEYLIAMSSWWDEEKKSSALEFEQLIKSIEHIKSIISIQQTMGKVTGMREVMALKPLLEDLISMKGEECKRHRIRIEKEIAPLPEMVMDRSKLLQILVNLITNGVDALKKSAIDSRSLIVRAGKKENSKVQIEVIDNGCGIDQDHLVKIFSYGFTTKTDGHGFGLHSSSLLAKEMGGELSAESPGIGKGSKFTLTLPLITNK